MRLFLSEKEKIVYPEGELKEYKKISKLPFIKNLDQAISLKKTCPTNKQNIKECKEAMAISLIGCVSRFREAIERHNYSVVKLFLSAGLDVNSLLLAAKAGLEQIEFITITPLSYAISIDANNIALLLLEFGANVNIIHEDGKTALGYAVQKYNKNIILAILKNHPLQVLEHIGKPPLLLAAAMGNGSISMVNFLLCQGANINSTYQQLKSKPIKITALSVAITCDDIALVHCLLMRNASMEHDGTHFALSQALSLGKTNMIETIFALNPEYCFDYTNKYHPYYHLPDQVELKKEIVHLLFKYKIIKGEDLKFLMFRMMVIQCLERDDLSPVVAQLENNRQLIDSLEFEGLRHYLCWKIIKKSSTKEVKGSCELLAQLLIKQGVGSIPNKKSQPSLIHSAVLYGNVSAFNQLLHSKADVNAVDYVVINHTYYALLPIQLTAYCHNIDNAIRIVDAFLSHGTQINSVNWLHGETVLFAAVYQQKPKLIVHLMKNGANPYLKNKLGNSVLFEAIERNIPTEIIQTLLSYMTFDITSLANEVQLAAIKGAKEITSLFIQYHLNEARAGDLLDNLSFATVIHQLLAIGITAMELTPFFKLGYDNTLKNSEKERRFYSYLSQFFIKKWEKVNLAPSALVGVMMLSGLISIAQVSKQADFKKLSGYIEQFDLSDEMSAATQHNLSLSETLIILIQYYHSLLDDYIKQLLAAPLILIEKKEQLIEAISFLNKQKNTQMQLFSLFSNHSQQIITHTHASIYLLTEELEKTIEQTRQKTRSEPKKQADLQGNLVVNANTVQLALEAKQAEIERKRNEQSQRDRQRHLQSVTFYSPVKKNNYSPLNTTASAQVTLTPTMEKAFNLLQKIPLIHKNERLLYVVGSQITRLLYPERVINSVASVDLDMALFVKPSAVESDLEKLGFSQNKHIHGLYTLKTSNHRIDLMVQEKRTRVDFCSSQIFCDGKGIIYDVTGRGINNLEKWTLETVIDAAICFKEDPIRILRAINFILRGYKPDENIQAALRMSYPSQLITAQIKPLSACMRKYLYTVDNPKFVALLQEYNLLQQLFGVEYQEDMNTTILNLWTNIIENLREEGLEKTTSLSM